jgi:hypothetical protein
MAEYFIVAGYNFEAAMNNTTIYAKIQGGHEEKDEPGRMLIAQVG